MDPRKLCEHHNNPAECDAAVAIRPRDAARARVLRDAGQDTPYDDAQDTLDIWHNGGRFTCSMRHALTSELGDAER